MAYWCGELCTQRAKQCCTVWNMAPRLWCDLCKSSCSSTWHKRGLPRASWDLQRSPAPCNWHGSQLHDCVLPSFLKMFVPQGIRWLQIWGVFFIFTYVTYVFIYVFIHPWWASCRLHRVEPGRVIRAMRQMDVLFSGNVSVSCWELHGLIGPGLMIPTPHFKCQRHWSPGVWPFIPCLIFCFFFFQVRSSSSESPPSSSSGHGRQWLRSSFFLVFLILSLAAAASTGCPSHLEVGFCWSMVVWPIDACSIP